MAEVIRRQLFGRRRGRGLVTRAPRARLLRVPDHTGQSQSGHNRQSEIYQQRHTRQSSRAVDDDVDRNHGDQDKAERKPQKAG